VTLRQKLTLGLLVLGTLLLLLGRAVPAAGGAVALEIKGAIGPATRDFIRQGLEQASAQGAEVLILEMDTPGGLDSSMRDIIQDILQSPIPVATWVTPEGARAASAGTYILYASHIAAMAPATNLGAATPVAIGGGGMPGSEPEPPAEDDDKVANGDDNGEAASEERRERRSPSQAGTASERKAINDAVAYIRGLAEKRGRNAEWAEEAVRDAVSLSSSEALERNVIDLIASSLPDLLTQMDGRVVEVGGTEVTLATAGLSVTRIEPDWRTRLLGVITDPTVAYLLMLIGIYGLIFEGYNPGAIVPGVIGAISLLLALFAFQILPVNYAGFALILLGIVLIIGETFVPSFGALGLGGIIAFVAGSVILMDSDIPGFGVSLPLIISIAATGAVVMLGIAMMAARTRYAPIVSGPEELVGAIGEAMEDFEGEGEIWVHAERWTAEVTAPVKKGQKLKVIEVRGLRLVAEPI